MVLQDMNSSSDSGLHITHSNQRDPSVGHEPEYYVFHVCEEALEQFVLLHHCKELIYTQFAIAICVTLGDDLLQFVFGHRLTKLLRNTLQVRKRNRPSLIIINQTEGFEQVILLVLVQDFLFHHSLEVIVVHLAIAIIIDRTNHFLNLAFLWLKAQSFHGNLQFTQSDRARSVGVKELKCFLDFNFLLCSEFSLLLCLWVDFLEWHGPTENC